MKRLIDAFLGLITIATVIGGTIVLTGALTTNSFARQDATMMPLEIVANR